MNNRVSNLERWELAHQEAKSAGLEPDAAIAEADMKVPEGITGKGISDLEVVKLAGRDVLRWAKLNPRKIGATAFIALSGLGGGGSMGYYIYESASHNLAKCNSEYKNHVLKTDAELSACVNGDGSPAFEGIALGGIVFGGLSAGLAALGIVGYGALRDRYDKPVRT